MVSWFFQHRCSVNGVVSYERNLQARQQCIKYHGVKYVVCDFDFLREYGTIRQDYIQVHHLIPIHENGKTYEVNPVTDIVPLCPNCHAMIHREKDTLTIEELKQHYANAQTSKRL